MQASRHAAARRDNTMALLSPCGTLGMPAANSGSDSSSNARGSTTSHTLRGGVEVRESAECNHSGAYSLKTGGTAPAASASCFKHFNAARKPFSLILPGVATAWPKNHQNGQCGATRGAGGGALARTSNSSMVVMTGRARSLARAAALSGGAKDIGGGILLGCVHSFPQNTQSALAVTSPHTCTPAWVDCHQ